MFPKVYVKKENIKVLFVNNLRFSKEKYRSFKVLTNLMIEMLNPKMQGK